MKRSRDSRETSPHIAREPKEPRRSARDQYDDPRSSGHHHKSVRDDNLSSNGSRWKDGKEVSPPRRRDRKRSHSPDVPKRDDRREKDRRDRDFEDGRLEKDVDRKDRDHGKKHRDKNKDRDRDHKNKDRDKERRRSREKDRDRTKSKEKESAVDIDLEVDEEEMRKLMGFVSFDSTKVS